MKYLTTWSPDSLIWFDISACASPFVKEQSSLWCHLLVPKHPYIYIVPDPDWLLESFTIIFPFFASADTSSNVPFTYSIFSASSANNLSSNVESYSWLQIKSPSALINATYNVSDSFPETFTSTCRFFCSVVSFARLNNSSLV